MHGEELVRLEHVSKTFPGVKALSDVSFSIEKGEVHALLGENGAGKSTLIKILTGVHLPDEGSAIYIDGEKFSGFNPIVAVQKGIAVTYQDFSLFPNLSVAENLAIGGILENDEKIINWREVKKIAKAAVERIGEKIDVNERLGNFSTAKQQLIAIARSLVYNAKLLILDEPTSALSNSEVDNLMKVIEDIKKEGISILFISHKLEEVFRISDRITVMRDGKYMGTYPKEEVDRAKVISMMVGRNVEFNRKTNDAITSNVLLEVNNLSRKGNYKDISFKVHKGEIVGITGLVGAGRTELCESIFGVTVPDSGTISLEGQKLKLKDTSDAMKAGISLVPESRQIQGLVLDHSIEDNITINVISQIANKFHVINRRKKHTTALEYIERLSVKPPFPDMQVSKLSGGNQQRVVIAKWVAKQPKLLIIDEPTNGVDVGAKEDIHNILRGLARMGIGIIMVSSDLPEILAVSDRILVMRRGRIVAEFNGDEATQEVIMNEEIQ